MSHLHFLGIAGTFMAGLAQLAAQLGYTVSGSDTAFYPPMGDAMRRAGFPLFDGYNAGCDDRPADCYLIGNALARGTPLVEDILRRRRAFTSGPQWLCDNVLAGRTVIAVAGTHGKTTTATLLVYLLERAGLAPGFLIGGIAPNFGVSARLMPESELFVIEADEYDSAFFDKQPKFMHYRPHIVVLNNLEFDHADIYPDVDAIIRQFHYLLRTVPDSGRLIVRADDANLTAVLRRGVWTPVEQFGGGSDWQWQYDTEEMTIRHGDKPCCHFSPPLPGAANRDNILAAVAAASAIGVAADKAEALLQGFLPPLRRLQRLTTAGGVQFFDDFAHHPTAMQKTIAALAENRRRRIIAVFEPRSNTMKAGVFKESLAAALAAADIVVAVGQQTWLPGAFEAATNQIIFAADAEEAADYIRCEAKSGDDVVLMSNGDALVKGFVQLTGSVKDIP